MEVSVKRKLKTAAAKKRETQKIERGDSEQKEYDMGNTGKRKGRGRGESGDNGQEE